MSEYATADGAKALATQRTDAALMPPPRVPKRLKRPATVLDEDVYSEGLSHIIARDFFPGLAEAEAQEEYLQALESKDKEWMREAGRRLTTVMTPQYRARSRSRAGATRFTSTEWTPAAATLSGSDLKTPGRASETPYHGSGMSLAERHGVDTDMSLGAFQAKYTSEDNESFNALLDRQNARNAAKFSFLHDDRIPANRRLKGACTSKSQLAIKGPSHTALITTTVSASESAAAVSARPSQDLSMRPASVDGFRDRQGAKNAFMFEPDGVEDELTTHAQAAESRSNAPPKSIQFGATRFAEPGNEHTTKSPPSPTMSAIDAAIAGHPRPTSSEVGYTGAETPRVNGYAFVDAEPTSWEMGVPVSEEEADAVEQEAAKRLLPKLDDAGPNPFTINKHSRREEIHRKLVEKADQGRRKGTRLDQLRELGITPGGRTPTPRFSTGPKVGGGRAGSLTPAAQKLAQRIGGTPRNVPSAFTHETAVTWTQTPRKRP